jgi:hypothetical protein
MARKLFVLGVLVMASASGVLGYQALTYYFYDNWPAVSCAYIVTTAFGKFPEASWHWANEALIQIGRLPVSIIGFAISFLLLLVSDVLRGRAGRQASS